MAKVEVRIAKEKKKLDKMAGSLALNNLKIQKQSKKIDKLLNKYYKAKKEALEHESK